MRALLDTGVLLWWISEPGRIGRDLLLPKLPNLHRDPFDRLLICEAIQEGVPLITPDEMIHRYPIKVIWG